MIDGFALQSLFAAHAAEIVLRGRVRRIDPDRFPVLRGCPIDVPPLEKQDAEVVVRQRVLRIDLERPSILPNRVVHLPGIRERQAEIEMRGGQLGLQSGRRREMRDGFGWLAELQIHPRQIIVDRDTNRSKGFGFVEMGSDAEAQAAIDALNGRDYDGRNLTVNEAKPREPRSGGGGGGYGGGGGGGRSGGGGGRGYGGGGNRY